MDIKEIKEITRTKRTEIAKESVQKIKRFILEKAKLGISSHHYPVNNSEYDYSEEIMKLLKEEGYYVELITYHNDYWDTYSMLIKWE